MPRIQITFDNKPFDTAEDTIHHIVTDAVNKEGGFNKAQRGLIANNLTKILHRYIAHIQDISGQEPYRFIATRTLQSDKGSRVVVGGFEKDGNSFNYNYGLNMLEYGWILGGDGFDFTRKSAWGLTKWLKAKAARGIAFRVYRWKKVKGEWKKIKSSGRQPSSDKDYYKIANQIIAGGKKGRTIKNWYKTALMPSRYKVGGKYVGNANFEGDIIEYIQQSGNLIPAVRKRVINKINKQSK